MSRFKEPIKAMRDRIHNLNNDIRNIELEAPDVALNTGNAEIKRRLVLAMNNEVAEFQAAIEFLESPAVQQETPNDEAML